MHVYSRVRISPDCHGSYLSWSSPRELLSLWTSAFSVVSSDVCGLSSSASVQHIIIRIYITRAASPASFPNHSQCQSFRLTSRGTASSTFKGISDIHNLSCFTLKLLRLLLQKFSQFCSGFRGLSLPHRGDRLDFVEWQKRKEVKSISKSTEMLSVVTGLCSYMARCDRLKVKGHVQRKRKKGIPRGLHLPF